MLNIEDVTPFEWIKPRRRSLRYCISPDEGAALFERWRQRFPKLRYMAPVTNIASTVDRPKPPEMVISVSPFELPHNTQIAGLLIGDGWKPRWELVPEVGDSKEWTITNVPWPRFNVSPPLISKMTGYLVEECLREQHIQVIWNYGNDDGPRMASYLFSTIRRIPKVTEALCVVVTGEKRYWKKETWPGQGQISQGAMAWAVAKPRRLAASNYLPIDADLAKLGFGSLPHFDALGVPR